MDAGDNHSTGAEIYKKQKASLMFAFCIISVSCAF